MHFLNSEMKKNIANIITGSRILFSMALLFFPVFSFWFYTFYILCGITDMIDGRIARKTNSESSFGAVFDTAADFIFVLTAFFKIAPALQIPNWLIIWVCVIALIKAINLISGFICQKKFVALHTVMNKVTGVLLFLLPLTLSFIELKYSALVICPVATFAAIQEGHYIRTGKDE